MVLIIDDEKIVRHSVMDVLNFFGIQAIDAASGQEGIRLLRENLNSIQVVLLDLYMPGMDGLETLRCFRAELATLPVILCSGQELSNPFGEFAYDPTVGFLPKPYSVELLLARIQSATAGNVEPTGMTR